MIYTDSTHFEYKIAYHSNFKVWTVIFKIPTCPKHIVYCKGNFGKNEHSNQGLSFPVLKNQGHKNVNIIF